MSVSYKAVGWNRQKKIYDWLILGFCVLYLSLFISLNLIFNEQFTFETLLIRSTATLAVLMLHVILAIGPLCRINKKFLPFLYNRRHLGVTLFAIALVHGVLSLQQFHALGNVNPLISLLTSNTNFNSLAAFPFQALGFAALLIFFLMAITSHDFWLHNLSPKVWKTLHMGVYVAYLLVIMHVMLGVIQYETSPVLFTIILAGSATLIVLHLNAATKEVRRDNIKYKLKTNGYVYVCNVEEIEDSKAKIFCIGQERVAVYRHLDKLYAIHNACKHQGGPLGEGKILDGCITCPWHGYQYLPHNGQSPPPFTEKVNTYDVKVTDEEVWLNPTPFAEGTARPGAAFNIGAKKLPGSAQGKQDDPIYIGWMKKAPNSYAYQVRKATFALIVLTSFAAFVLALSQKKFSTSSFEFGRLTEIKGIYLQQPVPSVKVIPGKDVPGNASSIIIPLVGYGKFGAEGTIAQLEKERNVSLDMKKVVFKGSLLYSDGKTLLQVDKNDDPLISVSTNNAMPGVLPKITDLGMIKLQGEILDPKCYFGVMKPGHGKPHRDCATRCLLGGISPVFRVRDEKRNSQYYLILGEHGEKINTQLKDFVADPVSLDAHAKQFDDWIVLYVNPKTIKRISAFSLLKHTDDEFASCGP